MLISFLLSLGIASGCILSCHILIHYFQLESYQFPGYFRTIHRNLEKSFLPGGAMTFLLIVSMVIMNCLPGSGLLKTILLCLILVAGGYAAGRAFSEKKAKKALKYTARIKRLYIVSFLATVMILFFAARSVLLYEDSFIQWQKYPAIFLLIFPVLLPFWVAFCGLLAWPIEKLISELYFRDAQRILRSRNDLIRIGVTGSWGKTSVKFILGTLLEEKYHTLVTPASFNTPMGVTKVIRTMLEPSHRVFVAEMGARHVGDIREMCRLVHPCMGILTSVGPQHLDTFKTVENVERTKYELIDALPEDGIAFFSDDNGICRRLYERTTKEKRISGLFPGKDDVWAEEITVTEHGSSFYLCTKDIRFLCSTALLGELNISNIVLCASVCLMLGMSAEQIARGIKKILPVEHRLQLINNPGGMTIIDDAFNSNILGAQQAFKVLKEMKGKRILITPGMVELGTKESELNREFGNYAADCCDIAVLIGKKRSNAIAEGLKEKGFKTENIFVASSLEEATEILRKLAGPGDTVLFENDLPDNYTE